MKVHLKAIVSNSDMIKNYKACRQKAESLGKVFILKNNQPDAVLLSIAEFERISDIIDHLESPEGQEAARLIQSMLKKEQEKITPKS